MSQDRELAVRIRNADMEDGMQAEAIDIAKKAVEK